MKSGLCGFVLWLLLTPVCVAEQVGTQRASGNRATSVTRRDELRIRRACLADRENGRRSPACDRWLRAFAEPEPEGALAFCRDSSTSTPVCECAQDGTDARCTFRICGYPWGDYKGAKLPTFAARVAKELRSWEGATFLAAIFVGYSDGTGWRSASSAPKPQPVPSAIARCAANALEKSASEVDDRKIDHRDAELATLRGCALEEALRNTMRDFRFEGAPDFSFQARPSGVDVDNPNIRAAELKIMIARGCLRLRR